jgi:hypothetical protein
MNDNRIDSPRSRNELLMQGDLLLSPIESLISANGLLSGTELVGSRFGFFPKKTGRVILPGVVVNEACLVLLGVC